MDNIETSSNSFDDLQPSTSSAGNFDPSSNLIPIEWGDNLDDFSTAIHQAAAKSVDQQQSISFIDYTMQDKIKKFQGKKST